MAKHRLHAAQIRAARQEVGGEGVPQLVGVSTTPDAGRTRVAAHDLPETLPRQRSTTR
jgi:hypothetical protein